MMNLDCLLVKISKSLGPTFNLTEVIKDIESYRSNGGSQEHLERSLNSIMKNYNQQPIIIDQISELLDVVTGWCNSRLRVWE